MHSLSHIYKIISNLAYLYTLKESIFYTTVNNNRKLKNSIKKYYKEKHYSSQNGHTNSSSSSESYPMHPSWYYTLHLQHCRILSTDFCWHNKQNQSFTSTLTDLLFFALGFPLPLFFLLTALEVQD